MTDQPPQVHPTQELLTPQGKPAQVDAGMVGLIEALWDGGYETLMCCENAGEAVRGGGTLIAEERWDRYAAFYDGFAWLKMPVDDMQRLVTFTEDIAKGAGLAPNVHLTPTGPTQYASLHFPARQISELTELLRSHSS
jgi:hypothetical protein